jgi:class 3 adenylate cyclase
MVPLYITVAVVLFAVVLHILSRNLAENTQSEDPKKRTDSVLMEQVEWLTYDARAKLGAALNDQHAVANNIATLFFDDTAFEQINDGTYSINYAPATNQAAADQLVGLIWPWPRFIHGQVVRELAAQGATAIGMDVVFPELRKDTCEIGIETDAGPVSYDEFFAREMKKAGNVYLAVDSNTVPALLFQTNAAGLASISSRADYAVLRRVKPFNEVRLWHPLLRNNVKSLGLVLDDARIEGRRLIIQRKLLEEDGPVDPLIVPLNPNGSMKMAADGQINFGDDPGEKGVMNQFPFVDERVWNLGLVVAAKALELDLTHSEIRENKIILHGPKGLTRVIPLDSAGFFYIDWSLRFSDLKSKQSPVYFGYLSEVLRADYGRTHGGINLADAFQGKIVLIGSVATGNNVSDVGSTPLESTTPLVTKHVNIANSLLTGRFVRRTSVPVEALIIVALGLLSAFLTWRTRVLVAAIGVAGLCLSYIVFATGMYLQYRSWIPIAMPVTGGLILPHFSLVTYRVMFEQKEQRRVRGIFSRIVSPDVVQELLSAEKLALGGARRKITVFFADVRGFTEFTDSTQESAEDFVKKSTMTEDEKQGYFDRIAAEQLATVNLYLGTIADTIKTHRGTLDKYMGDCVMAFWGAPTPNELHALCCVRAAVDSQRALYALNQQRFAENEKRKQENAAAATEGKPPIPMLPLLSLGTGINSGYATIGLMGSDATILNYTVFGREVNLASRLEGASGRGRIIISEATFVELQRDDPALATTCVAQAPITPKGFRQAIRIYEVPWKLAPPQEATPDTLKVAAQPVAT